MRRNVGVVGIFIAFCLQSVAVDNRNLTTTLAADKSAKNITLVGVKIAKQKSHSAYDDEEEPSTDVAADAAEGSRVNSKWETGNK